MTTKKLNKIELFYKVRVFYLKDQFTISRGSKKLIKVLDIILKKGKYFGYGECIAYDRYNEKLTNIKKLKPSPIFLFKMLFQLHKLT